MSQASERELQPGHVIASQFLGAALAGASRPRSGPASRGFLTPSQKERAHSDHDRATSVHLHRFSCRPLVIASSFCA
jgi:hypothetical protein